MGMYTELHFNARLKPDVPTPVLEILNYMIGYDKFAPAHPDHPLFNTSRWGVMLRCSSYYFDADTTSTLRYDDISKQHSLCIRTNFKNYDGEIEKFINWIRPYLDKDEGDFLGFHRYEETEEPTLIYAS